MGAIAAFAPASLTGITIVDAIERALLAAGIAWVGAHGRRWAWLVAGVLVTVGASGWSLLIALVGLAIVVGAGIPKRRNRAIGAVGIGLLVNAVFWYPPSSAPIGTLLAIIAGGVLVWSGFEHMRNRKRRMVRYGLWALGIYLALAGGAVLVAVGLAYGQVRTGGNAAQGALQAARDGDAEQAGLQLDQASASFEKATRQLNSFLATPAAFIPGVAQQLDAVRITVEEGQTIAQAGDDIVATADYEALQYQGKLDLAQVVALQTPTAAADEALRDAGERMEEAQEGALLPPLRSQMQAFSTQIEDAQRTTDLATDLLEVTPGLFGSGGQRRFLVIFYTPAELRGAGGFIGNFAELTATDGDVVLTRSGRISELIDGAPIGTRSISGPEDYIERWGRFRPWDYQQDATLSPDFPSVGQVMTELYPQSGGKEVQGMIGLDPTGLATLLELTGPVTVAGLPEPLTAENAVEVLTKTQYIDVPDGAERGEILTEAVRVTFKKLTQSTLPSPRKLADTLSPAARSGHLRVWSSDEREQETFERLGADGTLALPTGSDGFSFIQQNTGNNKLDAYLERTMDYRAEVDAETGKVTGTLRVQVKNDLPPGEFPDAVAGNNAAQPLGTNLAWFTLYTPHALTKATIDGKDQPIVPDREEGLNAYDTPFLAIPRGETMMMEFTFEGGVDLADGYELHVLPQPVANPDVLTATLKVTNGTTPSGPRVTLVSNQKLGPPLERSIQVTP
jgi:hypothetical protein